MKREEKKEKGERERSSPGHSEFIKTLLSSGGNLRPADAKLG